MKNVLKPKAMRSIAGIIALVAVIGFAMAGCNRGGGGAGIGGKPVPLPEKATHKQAMATFEQYAAYVASHPQRGETEEETKAAIEGFRAMLKLNGFAWPVSGSSCIELINELISELE